MSEQSSFLNIKCKKIFKECEYELKALVTTNKNCLQFEIRSITEPWIWRNEFTAQYIEDLTEKTGQKKTFFEFLGLIDECLNLKCPTKSSFDILTYQDLKNMNSKNNNNPSDQKMNTTASSQMSKNDTSDSSNLQRQSKRYLIISSNNQFDEKTHYPLSLSGEQINDPSSLKEIIKNLQKELLNKSRNHHEDGQNSSNSSTFYSSNGFEKKQQSQSNQQQNQPGSPRSTSGKSFYNNKTEVNKKEYDQLKVENELLKAKVKRIEDYFSQKQGAIEIEQLIKQKFALENEIDKMRILSSKRICELEVEVETKERQLNNKKQENLELQKQLTQTVCESEDTANKRIKAQLLKLSEETEQQLVLSKKTIQKQKAEIDKLQSEMEKHVNEDKKLKQRITQLEIELTNSQRRSNSRSNPLGARTGAYSNNSSHSSFNSRRNTPTNNNHISKLGYSSPSLQAASNRNRFNRVDNSLNKASTPQTSKNSLQTPKSNSFSSIRSHSLNSQNNTPNNNNNNNRFSRPGLGSGNTAANQRSNKFFSSNNNNNNQNAQQNNNNNSLNSSHNSRNSSQSNGSLNRQGVQNQYQNKRQPLYQVTNERQNSLNRNQQPQSNPNNRNQYSSLNRNSQTNTNNSNNISLTVKNIKSGSFDPIPENRKYSESKQTNNSNNNINTQGTPSSVTNRLYQPKIQQQQQTDYSRNRQQHTPSSRLNTSSSNNPPSLKIESATNKKNTQLTISTPSNNLNTQNSTRNSSNTTQPRYVPTNNFMKPLNRNNNVNQPYKVGQQQNQLRSHTQIQEKIDQTLFDDKHLLSNNQGQTELEMKIDKLQNILQSAKDMTAEDF